MVKMLMHDITASQRLQTTTTTRLLKFFLHYRESGAVETYHGNQCKNDTILIIELVEDSARRMADENIDDQAETNTTGNIDNKENGQCSQKIEQDLASLTVDANVHRIEKDNPGLNSDITSSEDKVAVKVHPLTERQHSLFKELSKTKAWKESFKKLEPLPLHSTKKDGHIRFVCISDTHNRHGKLNLPDGDILLHAGDFTRRGKLKEVESFCEFLKEIKNRYKHIVVIAGNHELTFDDKKDLFFGLFKTNADCNRGADLKEMLRNHCIYLEDEGIELMGFTIYGSPW